MFTGSGMPMRFADTDGTMIDVYQAATQMTDESGQTYPFTVNTLLDRALGAPGLLRRVHRQHAHRSSRQRPGRDGDRRLGAGARRAGRVGAADARLARRPQRLDVRADRLRRRRAELPRRGRRRRDRPARACCRRTFDGKALHGDDARRRPASRSRARRSRASTTRSSPPARAPTRRPTRADTTAPAITARRRGRRGRRHRDRHVDDQRGRGLPRRLRHLGRRAHARTPPTPRS